MKFASERLDLIAPSASEAIAATSNHIPGQVCARIATAVSKLV